MLRNLVLGPSPELIRRDHRNVAINSFVSGRLFDTSHADTSHADISRGADGERLPALLPDAFFQLDWQRYETDLRAVNADMEDLLDRLVILWPALVHRSPSRRSLKILLGHWLWRTICICHRHFRTARAASMTQGFEQFARLDEVGVDLHCHSLQAHSERVASDMWQTIVLQRALICVSATKAGPSHAPAIPDRTAGLAPLPAPAGPLRAVKNRLHRRARYAFTKTYLGRAHNVMVQLRLGQIPFALPSVPIPQIAPDPALRHALFQALAPETPWQQFLYRTCCDTIPTSLLELDPQRDLDFTALPEAPETVFTSNAFDGDEGFTHWLGGLIDKGKTRYICGQHGHPYAGMKLGHVETEIATADAFLSWGWHRPDSPVVPAFCFTKTGRELRPDPDGGILMLTRPPYNNFFLFDAEIEQEAYLENLHGFFSRIPASVKGKIRVKPHHSRLKSTATFLHKLRATGISVESATADFATLSGSARLIVFGYESSGIAHALMNDFPFVFLMEQGLDRLEPAMRPLYQKLIDAGIAFCDAEQMADGIARIEQSVPGWWRSEPVRSALSDFSEAFCRQSAHPVADLASLLKVPAQV